MLTSRQRIGGIDHCTWKLYCQGRWTETREGTLRAGGYGVWGARFQTPQSAPKRPSPLGGEPFTTPVVLEDHRCGGSEVADVPLAGWAKSRATTDPAANAEQQAQTL
jgi:hypothetical protein